MTKEKIGLIQLVSEQTMQNLLPVLALKPEKLYHLSTPKTAGRSSHIMEAARQAGVEAQVENVRMSEMPSIAETSRAVERIVGQCAEEEMLPVVNFTGGTKLMSIGAYEAALRKQVSSVYVDTDHQAFHDGNTSTELRRVLHGDFSFTPLQRALTVNAIAAANGRERVTGGRDWHPFVPLASHLFENAVEEEETWQAMHGSQGLCPGGREPRRAADWLELISRPIQLPAKVAALAAACGVARIDGISSYLPDTKRADLERFASEQGRHASEYYEAVRPLQFSIAFLTGGWWEVVVADAADRSGQFRDLRWSVNVGERAGGYDAEDDIVAVDGVQIVYISCKRGGVKARLVPLLDELDNRSRTIGGNFTRRFLAVCNPPVGQTMTNLSRRARELNGIQIITADDLENPAVFARRQR